MENCLAEVPYRKNGKSVKFYQDHLEFNGKSIRYDDIAVLMTNGGTTTRHTYLAIPVGRSFDGAITFKMKDGKTHNINLSGMSMFGIPIVRNPRKCEKLFPPLFYAVDSIVARNMAQKCIDTIIRGNSVEVGGLEINSREAKSKEKSSKKKPVIINSENYGDSQLTKGAGVAVLNNLGETLWNSSVWNNKNNLLVPYILDAIFGSESSIL